jgi:ABC-type glutathione transport system ATPase component
LRRLPSSIPEAEKTRSGQDTQISQHRHPPDFDSFGQYAIFSVNSEQLTAYRGGQDVGVDGIVPAGRASSMSGLRLAGIVHRYGTTTAIDGLNLEVREGELITLLGPSGCGKTTTLRIVAGFLAPEGGEVWFDERPMNGVPPHRRNTAMVFQSYALFPHMTVAENVTFGLRMRKVAAAEQRSRLAEVLSLVSLTGLEERRPGQLSGGQ